jgi:hypothetical protein
VLDGEASINCFAVGIMGQRRRAKEIDMVACDNEDVASLCAHLLRHAQRVFPAKAKINEALSMNVVGLAA